MEYKICSRCIMDNVADKTITFDEHGVCNHCRQYDKDISKLPQTDDEKKIVFDELIAEMKAHGKGKKYDCVLGISGGVDSAYLLHVACKAGLRVLAVHVDAGWNTDVAVENIQKLCSKLNVELHKIVVDWNTMKELQRAYMFSGLSDLDVPQDHAFLAATYMFTRKNGIHYMLNGSNYATEGIMPATYGYSALDYSSIKDIYKKCGRGKLSLRKYPKMSLLSYSMLYMGYTKRVNLLNYLPYSKKDALSFLHTEYGWNYYGGKHYESIFTKFFQAYYLPRKYGYDKKRAHISSLIVGGELTREEALLQIADNSEYPEEKMIEDRDYILNKLDISLNEWEKIMASTPKSIDDYRNNKKFVEFLTKMKHRLGI